MITKAQSPSEQKREQVQRICETSHNHSTGAKADDMMSGTSGTTTDWF